MSVANGKFRIKTKVGAGIKKLKEEKAAAKDKPPVTKVAKKKKAIETVVKSVLKEQDKKKKKKKVAAPAVDTTGHLRISATSALSFDIVEEDGKTFVAARKFYCTKADPSFKPARGGFNMDADASALRAIAKRLKELADQLDA